MKLDRALTLLAEIGRVPRLVFVTGAGLSAASGIPTFRGPEGYWTVGSRNYRPEDMATQAAFRAMPEEVWRWYLYRRAVCRAAAPARSHHLLVDIERRIGDRLTVVTQNVDGLHLRAGQSDERTFHIHGNIDFLRCTRAGCSDRVQPVPDSAPLLGKDDPLSEADFEALCCRSCGARARPHVLWFDEYYDEELFRAESALRAAMHADAIITIGTSGATNLPHQIVGIGLRRGAVLIDINPEPNPFSEAAQAYERGTWVTSASDDALEALADALSSSGA